MNELTTTDIALVYKHLNQKERHYIEYDAYNKTLDEFDGTDTLEAAHNNPDTSFDWEDIDIEVKENHDLDGYYLHPLSGNPGEELPECPDNNNEIAELAHDLAQQHISNVKTGIRKMQEETMFSPREFVALVLSDLHETEAANEMNITVGNYRGKKGDIADKIETAEQTLTLAQKIRDEDTNN